MKKYKKRNIIKTDNKKEYMKLYKKIYYEKLKDYYKDYYKRNITIIKNNQQEYRIKNKKKLTEYHKQYYLNNRDYHKQYYLKNKEEILKKNKERYELNKNNKPKIKTPIINECILVSLS